MCGSDGWRPACPPALRVPDSALTGPRVLVGEDPQLQEVFLEPSRQEIANSLGNRFAALRREELLLLGDIHHHLGNLVQGLFCVREPLAQESVACAQPHVVVLQGQEGDEEVNQVFLDKTAVAKASV